jgi:hypothetical protein
MGAALSGTNARHGERLNGRRVIGTGSPARRRLRITCSLYARIVADLFFQGKGGAVRAACNANKTAEFRRLPEHCPLLLRAIVLEISTRYRRVD